MQNSEVYMMDFNVLAGLPKRHICFWTCSLDRKWCIK